MPPVRSLVATTTAARAVSAFPSSPAGSRDAGRPSKS